jgi:hypothetical protein
VEAVVEMYTEEREEALLCGSPDYVIDAIDNIDTKVRSEQINPGAAPAAPAAVRVRYRLLLAAEGNVWP